MNRGAENQSKDKKYMIEVLKLERKNKLCFIYLCLCVGLTACGMTITEGRSESAVPETEQDIPEENVLAESPDETISQERYF